MKSMNRLSPPIVLIVCTLALLLYGCASPTAGGDSTPTPGSAATPTAPTASGPCATRATATAEAWATGKDKPQVTGSINGAAATTLSNFVYPLGLPNEGQFSSDFLAALAWSPDAQHLAVAVEADAGPGRLLYPYVVDTTSHAVTRVNLPGNASIPELAAVNRIFAWADNHTLLIFGGFSGGDNGSAGTVSYSYDLTSASATPLPGVTAAYEGVVRCSTLFYLEITPLTQIGNTPGQLKGTAKLHRYDLASHSEIGSPITLGETSTFRGAEGNVSLMGWDASPDGTRIVYQQTAVSANDSSSAPTLTSKFFVANADGSAASPILTGAIANSPAFLAISPDGKLVAVTGAQPSPMVFSGSLSGGAASFYQPDASGPPLWLADSAQFEADSAVGATAGIERWALNTGGGKKAGSRVDEGGSVPATLP